MGLMNCVRKDCGGVCSEYYIDEIGYLCANCKRDFEEYVKQSYRISSIKKMLDEFVTIEKDYYQKTTIDELDEFFNKFKIDN